MPAAAHTTAPRRRRTGDASGAGAVQHVINETGAQAQGTVTVPGYLVSYP